MARLPPEEILLQPCYKHLGNLYYIDRNRAVQPRDPNDPEICDDQVRAEEDYLENYAWRIGDLGLRPLADHAPVNYVWPVTAATP